MGVEGCAKSWHVVRCEFGGRRLHRDCFADLPSQLLVRVQLESTSTFYQPNLVDLCALLPLFSCCKPRRGLCAGHDRAAQPCPYLCASQPPSDAGLRTHALSSILGGSPAENARHLTALLNGEISAYRDAVLLNSAAALLIAGLTKSLKEGVAIATHAIDSGTAKNTLELLSESTKEI